MKDSKIIETKKAFGMSYDEFCQWYEEEHRLNTESEDNDPAMERFIKRDCV